MEPAHLRGAPSQRLSMWAAVVSGLLAAFTAAALVCRAPQSPTPQLALVLLAGAYLLVAALSGATGSYVFWIRSRAWPVPDLVELLQRTICGWVWIPAIVLLSRQDSVWAPAVAAAGAVVLAASLRQAAPATSLSNPEPEIVDLPPQEMFAQSLKSAPIEWYGPIVAVCLFAEAFALGRGWLFPACALLALAGFLFAWARTPATQAANPASIRKLTSAALRQTKSAGPALVVTVLAMMIGMRHDIEQWEIGSGLGHRESLGQSTITQKQGVGAGGHISIVLLTAPQKQTFLFPRAKDPLLQNTRLTKPLVIQFDGEYWYFQPPDSDPGPGAFVTHGSPLAANIHSSLAIPLLMQAHQHLGAPMPLDCCREVDVEVANHEEGDGAVVVGMMLTDSTLPGKRSLLLGEQSVPSSQQDSSASTTLHFRIRPRSESVSSTRSISSSSRARTTPSTARKSPFGRLNCCRSRTIGLSARLAASLVRALNRHQRRRLARGVRPVSTGKSR